VLDKDGVVDEEMQVSDLELENGTVSVFVGHKHDDACEESAEEEVAWHVDLTGRIEEMERQKAAAVAEEDYLTAGEIKRSIAELVEQSEALERAARERTVRDSSSTSNPAPVMPDPFVFGGSSASPVSLPAPCPENTPAQVESSIPVSVRNCMTTELP